MSRIILVNIFLLFLPFILFAIYAWVTKRAERKGSLMAGAPLTMLSLIGVLLVIGMVTYFISFEGGPPGGKYTPPVYKDGKLQPGRIE